MWRVAVFMLLPTVGLADSYIAARTIRAHAIIGTDDIVAVDAEVAGAITEAAMALGLEARVAIYAGRPILPGDLGPAAIVERNQPIKLYFQNASLAIHVEGRALDRGSVGDVIKVMNLASRTTVFGVIDPDGSVRVGQGS